MTTTVHDLYTHCEQTFENEHPRGPLREWYARFDRLPLDPTTNVRAAFKRDAMSLDAVRGRWIHHAVDQDVRAGGELHEAQSGRM